MNRRNILKSLGILPFAGGFIPHDSQAATAAETLVGTAAFGAEPPNIYQSIGVEPVINCRGTFTIIGGSIERPEVLTAMKSASGYFVQYDELATGIGQKLAKLTGAEWGMVSAGCAAGLKHVTAACVTGGNPEKLIRIPDLTGFEKTEVIIPAHSRNVYDHALRNVGVTVITVNTPEELQASISSRTALIYITTGNETETGKPLSLEAIAGIAKPKGIPVIVDAAAEDLTIPNIHLQRGATVVAYSGGKAICGPQCAGLLLGSKDILMSAWQASAPHHGPGRDNKIGKEEMMGMLAAVEAWTTRDHAAEWKMWLGRLDFISQKATKIEGVTAAVVEPTGVNNRSPRLTLTWNPDKIFVTGEDLAEEFARNKPRIAIGGRTGRDGMTSISLNPSQMQPGAEKVVADRIVAALTQKRSPRKTDLAAAGVNIAGHWIVTVEYFTSKSEHNMFLEQDGNWIQGTHRGDFSVQEIAGMVEGDQVKLATSYRVPGDGVTFMFSGTVTGETISGSIYLGEYLNAKFTAKKSTYRTERRKVVIPGGPPLST